MMDLRQTVRTAVWVAQAGGRVGNPLLTAVSNGLHLSAARLATIDPAVQPVAAMVEPALDSIPLGVETTLAGLSARIQFLVHAVTTCVQTCCALRFAVFFCMFCTGIQARIYAVTFCVQSCLGCKAALIQPFVDAFATLIQPLVDSITAILCCRGNGGQHEQCGCEQIYISLHVQFPPFAGHDLYNAATRVPVDGVALSATTIVRNNDLHALRTCEIDAQRTASKQHSG
jgi:hypothetical protein